jgi:HAD superfamily hydrolase (TIGR01509 family)
LARAGVARTFRRRSLGIRLRDSWGNSSTLWHYSTSQVMGQAVDAVLFDLSEVCLRGLKGTHAHVGELLGLPLYPQAFLGDDATRLFHGEITEEEYWQALIRTNGWAVDVAALKTLVRHNFARIDGTEAIIRALKDQGYRLGLLSVHAREWVEYCQHAFGYHDLFDVAIYSFDYAVSKPQPRAYQLALEGLGTSAERTLFIDDSRTNVWAATELGFQTIHFVTAKQLRLDLLDIGLLELR